MKFTDYARALLWCILVIGGGFTGMIFLVSVILVATFYLPVTLAFFQKMMEVTFLVMIMLVGVGFITLVYSQHYDFATEPQRPENKD